MSKDVAPSLDKSKTPAVVIPPPKVYDMRGRGDGEIAPTLCTDHSARPSDMCPVVFTQNSRSEVRLINKDGQIAGAVTSEPGAQQQNYLAEPKAFTQNQAGDVLSSDIAPAMGTNSNATGRNTPKVHRGATVRRLVPAECEKLQGFLPGYTLVPYRGKPAADGNRYKAIGNSMAVPVMRWIGERIQIVETLINGEIK